MGRTYNRFLIAKWFLEAWLSSVSDEDFEVRMSQNVVLRQPLGQEDVGGQVIHIAGLPLPDDTLFHASETSTYFSSIKAWTFIQNDIL